MQSKISQLAEAVRSYQENEQKLLAQYNHLQANFVAVLFCANPEHKVTISLDAVKDLEMPNWSIRVNKEAKSDSLSFTAYPKETDTRVICEDCLTLREKGEDCKVCEARVKGVISFPGKSN